MSLSSLLNIGTRSMNASYAALQVTGHNIANASTGGYSRQTLQVETAFSQQTGRGFFGKGIDVTTVARAHNEFLTREVATTQALAAADEARSTQLQRIEAAFQTGEAGLGYAVQSMFSAFASVASAPADLAVRQAALARVDDVATRFRNADAQLDDVQRGIAEELRASVARINGLTTQVAGLNRKIASVQGLGHVPNDLLDARERAIGELSRDVQVTTVGAEDGTVAVFMGGGQKLVLGGESTALALMADAYDPQRVQLAIAEGGTMRALPDGYLAGGAVAGMLRVQNHDLPEARATIGRLASAVAAGVNAQQALGLDLGQPTGPGAPLLTIGAPQVLPATGNATVDAGVSIAVVDASALQASDYELVADPSLPAGQYRLTRLADGQSQTVTSGQVVDGMRIDVAAPLPAVRDRFLLQPTAHAAGVMARALDDPRGIAAASPVTATFAVANTGTATLRSLAAVDPAINPDLTATLTFTDDAGQYGWTLVDTTGTLPTTTGTGTWTPGQPITLNGFALELNGAPRTGDTVTVARTPDAASSNGNANALQALGEAGIVGGQTVTDAWASAIAGIGVRVQGATAAADQSATLAADAQAAASSVSGVNLDEEAARLIQFQQSYQAAAKILQIAQTLFETLLLR